MPSYLTLQGVSKHYGAGPAVVSDCNLDVARGEFITLLGPSGCGKTTVLRMIAGLVPPSAGRVMLGGEDITARPVHARNIGLVFQNYALFPHLSVERNVAFGLEMRGIRGRAARERAGRALDLVRLGRAWFAHAEGTVRRATATGRIGAGSGDRACHPASGRTALEP